MRRRAAALALALAGAPVAAQAHLASTGLGPVYDGAWHLVLSPGQIVTFLASGLYAGRCGAEAARWCFLLMPLAWAAAWAVGPFGPAASTLLPVFAMMAAGLLLSANVVPRPGVAVFVLIVIAAAAGIGYDDVAAPSSVLGAAVVLFVVVALAASWSLPLRAFYPIVALRVAGSWTAALGLLLAGWWLHGRGL